MIRAILAGTKSQTRRLVTEKQLQDMHLKSKPYATLPSSPFGGIGDVLWVKETWRVAKQYDAWKPRDLPMNVMVSFATDTEALNSDCHGKWRTPLFMCERFSRIRLEITAIRIQRLDDCSEGDARAEGVGLDLNISQFGYKRAYKNTWESIHGIGSWDANPLVWVISFNIQ